MSAATANKASFQRIDRNCLLIPGLSGHYMVTMRRFRCFSPPFLPQLASLSLGTCLAVLLAGGIAQAVEPGITSARTNALWNPKGLGNIRARLKVTEKSEAVWAHIPWRRRDTDPEKKDIVVVDAATGNRISNVLPVRITREFGDLLFQPETVPGEYYVYYLPFKSVGEWYFPTTLYLAPTNTADQAWIASCSASVKRIQASDTKALASAELIDLQPIDDFHRFDPMEIIPTVDEMQQFLASYGRQPFLAFLEDRRYPIRMTKELPLRWVQQGPAQPFSGEACRGEFYPFQVGIYACGENVEHVTVHCSDLIGSQGTSLPGSTVRCFNLAGTNWLGIPVHHMVRVPKGQVQALWLGLQVPKDAPAQNYRGTVTVADGGSAEVPIKFELKVGEPALSDAGDSDLSRQSRLRWLDSTIGLDDEVFAPYAAVVVKRQTVGVLGRKTHFNNSGLLDSIVSTFSRNVDSATAPERELLAGPMQLVAETAAGPVRWKSGHPTLLGQSSGAVTWQAMSTAGPLELECRAKMECDGYVNYRISLRARESIDLRDVRLEIPLRREVAKYLMGLGHKGGDRPAHWEWKWDVNRSNNQLWIGDVDLGISCKLKHVEDRWDLANLQQSGPYRDWSNEGRGGCNVEESRDRVVIRAYTGPRLAQAGETLHFNFGLLITPVKLLDKAHWQWRYFHREHASAIPEIAQTGATLVNLHQGDALNPYINYPFLSVDQLSAYTREAHARQMKVKIYYTIRELSDYTAEFWALRSLGNEVFADGPGFHLADQFAEKKSGQSLPKTGDSWLCEHVVDHYVPAWHTPLGPGRVDAAIATTGLSRWHNYYLEGLGWLIRNVGIDGLYLDGVGYDREIMKRVRKVMQRSRPGCLIDFHSGNNYHPEYGLNNCANQYLELFPCIDSLWFGEGFDYNESPDYWLIEMAGIPYGLFGEMLQGGGNPWRGMLFGMTSRLGWGGDPRPVWKVWDEFGIQDARMAGYWDPRCPAKTGRKDVLATAYVKPKQTLISVASWATNAVKVRLQVDTRALKLKDSRTTLYAPPIRGFQPEAQFHLNDEIPVTPGRGWLLLAEEREHSVKAVPALWAGKTRLLEERFDGSALAKEWGMVLSSQLGTSLAVTNGQLQIKAAANAAAFAERSLPAGVSVVTCVVDARDDQGASWGPGLALVWPNGKTLRVNVRSEGRFGVDDGRQQILEGFHEATSIQLIIALDDAEVVVYAAPDGGFQQELARFPRAKFAGDPALVRIGKMSQGAKNEDFSTLGPAGLCRVSALQVWGVNSAAVGH